IERQANRRQHADLSQQPPRLRRLRTESAVLPQHDASKDRPPGERGRTGRGAPVVDDEEICPVTATSEEGRDAVRAPQTHLAIRQVAATRAERRPRRVPIGGNRTEFTKNGSVADAEKPRSRNGN